MYHIHLLWHNHRKHRHSLLKQVLYPPIPDHCFHQKIQGNYNKLNNPHFLLHLLNQVWNNIHIHKFLRDHYIQHLMHLLHFHSSYHHHKQHQLRCRHRTHLIHYHHNHSIQYPPYLDKGNQRLTPGRRVHQRYL